MAKKTLIYTDNSEKWLQATTYFELLQIFTHPAFRLGWLDATHGRPLDHDDIEKRLQKTGTVFESCDKQLTKERVWLAQIRYEEGRMVAVRYNHKPARWNRAEQLPAVLNDLCHRLAHERQ